MTKPLEYTHTFSGAGEFQVPTLGRFMLINDASGDVWVSLNHGSELKRGKKSNIAAGEQIKHVTIRSAIAQTVRFTISDEKQEEGRDDVAVSTTATISASNNLNNPGDVSAGAAATLLIAANANRDEVEFSVPSDQPDPVRVGDATVTAASGSIIEPGCSKVFSGDTAFYAVRTGSTNITVCVLELETI